VRNRFFFQNFLYFTLPVISVVLITGIIASLITIKETRNSVFSINEQTVERVKEGTELILNEVDAQSMNYNVSPYVMLRLEELLQTGYSGKPALDVAYMIKPFLDANVNSKLFLHSIYIYLDNEEDNFFASAIGLANSQNHKDMEWLINSRKVPGEIPQWLEIRNISTYSMSNYSTEVLSVYKRWYRSGKKEPFGMIVINIYADYLNDFLNSYQVYPEQNILLTSNDGRVSMGAGDMNVSISEINHDYYVSQRTNERFGITYYSLIPKNILLRQIWELMSLILSGILGALLLGGILSYVVTRRYVRIIDDILNLLESAEQGREIPEIRRTNDVYGFIMQNIVKTFLRKNSLDRQLMEKEYMFEKMHFAFLQAQLHPHFLFNTLKNIFWKTVKLTGEPNDASVMIDLLSSLLYYILVNPDKTVLIEKELDNTERYIRIQQMRFDYGFKVEWDLQGDLEQVCCIKFLLQPLIENCISHSMATKKDGWLLIRLHNDGSKMKIAVIDNGKGFTAERLAEINDRLTSDAAPEKGIGLYNLNKRLILTYGEEARLVIASTPGERTEISFSIPVIKSMEEE